MKLSIIKYIATAAAFVLATAALALAPQPGGAVSAQTGAKMIMAHYQNLSITIDGRTIIPKDAAGNTVYPFVCDDRTYLPVRALANALGCGVSWDEANSTVVIATQGGTGPSYGAPTKRSHSERITIKYDDISVMVDGKKLAVENEPFTYLDSVYLPVREIANALGCKVAFDDDTNVIGITTSATKTNNTELPAKPAAPATPPATPTTPPTAPASPHATPTAPPAAPAPAQSNSADPASLGSFDSTDLAFVIGGKTVRLDQNISVIRDILGAPREYDEVESCAYTGLDKFFIYSGLEVGTLPINGDLICSIDVFDGNTKTAKNITVGNSLAQIEKAYGNDYTYENGVLIYWAGPQGNPKTPQLYFMMNRNETVDSFGMYNGKSAG
ncbi:MAG: copper amine oxidase N-terminal domain-containing protein [Oscillospiraceae bacterium]|nr:copper amine oxidase N-terminal domain-containing protein [Oscillospiraceae bacterium]